eukprot:20090_1
MLVAFYCLLISQVLEARPADCPPMHESGAIGDADCFRSGNSKLTFPKHSGTDQYTLQCCADEMNQCPYFDWKGGKKELGWKGPASKSGCSKGLCEYPGLVSAFSFNPCPVLVHGYDPDNANQVDFDDDLFYEEAVLNLQIAEEGIEFARAVKAKKRAEELMKPSQRSSARLRRYHRTKPRYYD